VRGSPRQPRLAGQSTRLAFRALFLSVRVIGQASSLAGFGRGLTSATSQCA